MPRQDRRQQNAWDARRCALRRGFSNQTFTIIRRGEDLTVDLAEVDGTAKFQIEPNMTAYLADLFEIEVELVAELIGRITPALVPESVEALSDTQTLLDSDGAGRCLADAFGGDDLSPDAQRSLDPISIAGVTADCAVTAIKAAAGIPGFIFGTIISVVTIPGDLPSTFTAGMSAVTNPLGYTITVTAPPSLSVLDRQTRPDNCEVRRLSQYSTAEGMGLDDDDLGWYLPWDEFPGSTIGRSSTTSDLTVLLRGPSGKLPQADIDRLASYIRDTNFEEADPFIVCTNADGVYWVEQAPPPNLPPLPGVRGGRRCIHPSRRQLLRQLRWVNDARIRSSAPEGSRGEGDDHPCRASVRTVPTHRPSWDPAPG